MTNSPERSDLRGICTLVAFFALPPFALFAACDILVHGCLSALPTSSQKVYYLVVALLLSLLSIASCLAGRETLRGQARQPYRWAVGGLILSLLIVSFFHPSGPGP